MRNYVRSFVYGAKIRARSFFSKESGEVNIVAIVVLIGIAVLLAIIFKDAISSLLTTLFGTIETNATGAIATTAPAGAPLSPP